MDIVQGSALVVPATLLTSNPAKWKASAISRSPLLPSSRKMATRGWGPPMGKRRNMSDLRATSLPQPTQTPFLGWAQTSRPKVPRKPGLCIRSLTRFMRWGSFGKGGGQAIAGPCSLPQPLFLLCHTARLCLQPVQLETRLLPEGSQLPNRLLQNHSPVHSYPDLERGKSSEANGKNAYRGLRLAEMAHSSAPRAALPHLLTTA